MYNRIKKIYENKNSISFIFLVFKIKVNFELWEFLGFVCMEFD